MEKTDWFPAGKRPHRKGVYQTDAGYQHWNGEFWGFFCNCANEAYANKNWKSFVQRPRWRGLTQNPEAA